MTEMDWAGRIVDGRYVVEALIGRGGMGVVLAARHKFTGARVAVKMMRGDLGLDAVTEGRFVAEARIPATIGHRSVVKTLDAGKTPEGELYLVMELLTGRSLRHDMMRGVGAPSVRRIGMELLDVLAAAHARGIVHRDVKPENVFLVEPDASVKLLDFGITKVLAGGRSVLQRTAAGVLLGTLEYMAPEQLADASGVDARADLWAVSVILYEMLAGRRPHRATTVQEMFAALIRGQPDPIRLALPSATPDTEAFFARALAREPGQRFATAAEMAVALARLPLAASAPIVAKPASGSATVATGFAATAATPGSAMVSPPASAASRPAVPSAPAPNTPVPITPLPRAPVLQAAPVAGAPPGGRLVAPVLSPFSGTPALLGATPEVPEGYAAPSQRPTMMSASPTTGTIATVARTIETPAAPARRRPGLVAAAIATVAVGAVIVVVASRSEPHAPPPPPQEGSQRVAAAVPPSAVPASPSAAPAAASASLPAPAAVTPASPLAEPSAAAAKPPEAAASKGSSSASPHGAASPTTRPSTPSSKPSAATTNPSTPSRRRTGASREPAVDAAASPASLQTASAGRPEPGPAGSPAPATPTADTCAVGCKLLAGCHLGSSGCEADCARNATLHGCLEQAGNDCNRFASCWFASSCRGATPGGTHSCSDAMDCEAGCGSDTACICRCVAGLSVRHAVALLAYNGCALQCRDADCIARQCAAQARWCRAE